MHPLNSVLDDHRDRDLAQAGQREQVRRGSGGHANLNGGDVSTFTAGGPGDLRPRHAVAHAELLEFAAEGLVEAAFPSGALMCQKPPDVCVRMPAIRRCREFTSPKEDRWVFTAEAAVLFPGTPDQAGGHQ